MSAGKSWVMVQRTSCIAERKWSGGLQTTACSSQSASCCIFEWAFWWKLLSIQPARILMCLPFFSWEWHKFRRVKCPLYVFFSRVRTPCGHGAQVIVEGREKQSDGGEKNKDHKRNPKTTTKGPQAESPPSCSLSSVLGETGETKKSV